MKKAILIICSSLFFLSFFFNLFHIAGQKTFETYQKDSESLVIGRLIAAQQSGLFSYAGLTGSIDIIIDRGNYSYIYNFYKNNLKINKDSFKPYYSQIGGQSIFFSLISKISPMSNKNNLKLLWAISSLMFSITLAFFIFWIKKQFNLTTAIISFLFILCSKWITVYGRNLWWVLWSFYFPFVYLLFFLKKNEFKKISNLKLFLVAFFLILFKLFFTGFEFITTFLIMLSMPVIFYDVLRKKNLKIITQKLTIIFGSSICSIIVSSLILIYQLSIVTGSVGKGLDHILFSLKKRTHSNSNFLPEMYQESLNSNITEVIYIYLKSSVVGPINFMHLILIFLISSICLLYINKNSEKKTQTIALTVSLGVSLCAPLSWFIIFKAHSYIHKHMNVIVWYMPFMFFGFIVISNLISSLKFQNRQKPL